MKTLNVKKAIYKLDNRIKRLFQNQPLRAMSIMTKIILR